jgi:hypothetical protein
MNSAAGGRRGGERGHLTTFATPTPAASRATILLFPIARQRAVVGPLAARMLRARTDEAAERILQKRMAQLGRGLRAKKVTSVAIDRQVRSFEAAVRPELWWLMFPPPPRRRPR